MNLFVFPVARLFRRPRLDLSGYFAPVAVSCVLWRRLFIVTAGRW